MDTKKAIQNAKELSTECQRCHKTKPNSEFNPFPTFNEPGALHRQCRECRTKYFSSYDSKLITFLTSTFQSTLRSIEDPQHPNYANWGGRGIQNKFKNVDEFITICIDYYGYNSVENLKGLTLGLISFSLCLEDRMGDRAMFHPGNIHFAVGADQNDIEKAKQELQEQRNARRSGRKDKL